MAIDVKLITSEELFQMEDDGFTYELIDGELIRMPPPGFQHAEIVSTVIYEIVNHVRRHALGKVLGNGGFNIRRDPDTVLAPDVAFVRTRGTGNQPPPILGYPDFVPDIAFEVVSPSDSASYVQRKVQNYLVAGVPMVVILWPQTRTVTVHGLDGSAVTLSESDQFEGGSILPGLSVPVTNFFT